MRIINLNTSFLIILAIIQQNVISEDKTNDLQKEKVKYKFRLFQFPTTTTESFGLSWFNEKAFGNENNILSYTRNELLALVGLKKAPLPARFKYVRTREVINNKNNFKMNVAEHQFNKKNELPESFKKSIQSAIRQHNNMKNDQNEQNQTIISKRSGLKINSNILKNNYNKLTNYEKRRM